MLKKTALALVASTALFASCTNTGNVGTLVSLYATDGAKLYTFDSSQPIAATEVTLTGLNANTSLVAMDVNPRGGGLTGLGSDGQSYAVDPAVGIATPKGTPDTSVSFANKSVEIDYNPRAGAGTANEGKVYRVTTNANENYRRQDTTGAKLATDTAFAYKTGDVNAGKTVVVSAVAYTNSQISTAVPASTTVYVIDSQNDVLARLGGATANTAACPNATNPDCGQLTTIGKLGVDVSDFVGLDIYGPNLAYATAFSNGSYNLYSVDLSSGLLTFISGLNPKITPLRAVAVVQK